MFPRAPGSGFATLVFGFLLCAGPVLSHQKEDKPAIPTEKVKERDDLTNKVDVLLAQGKFPEAVDSAKSLVKLTTEIHGEKNWRTVDAQLTLKFAKTAKGLPEDKQTMLKDAMKAEREAKVMEFGRPKEALKLA
jgi:hypothetical protein